MKQWKKSPSFDAFWILNPLSARFFTVFRLMFIRGQSVTQGSMGHDPPRGPGL